MAMEHEIATQDKTSKHTWKSMAEDEPEKAVAGGFDCNICLDTVQDPVVTLCGHLYCWPCIYKWIHRQNPSPENQEILNPRCPVCKTEVSQKTIVPLYGRGQTEEKARKIDMVVPRRPPTPRQGVLDAPPEQRNRGGGRYQRRAPPPLAMPGQGGGGGGGAMAIISPSPTTGMLGEMVTGRILGDLQTPLFATPNSYNLAGISTRRAQRQTVEADRSLSRIFTFLFCCIIVCLFLFS